MKEYEVGDVGQDANQIATSTEAAAENAHSEQPVEDSPDQIRAGIVETRREMSATINAIQERLDPERLKNQVTESVREATIGKAEQVMNRVDDTARETGTTILDTIRLNPIPAVMVGVGLFWLFRNRADGNYRFERGDYRTSYGSRALPRSTDRSNDLSKQAQRVASQAGDQARQITDQAGHAVGNFGDQARRTVGEVGNQVQGQVSDLAQQVQGQVSDVSDQLQSHAQELGNQVQTQAWQTRYTFEQSVSENPLAAGAVALAIGAAVGLAVPGTPPENQLMGEAREQVVQKAQSVAQDALESAQRVVEQTKPAAEQALKNEMSSTGNASS